MIIFSVKIIPGIEILTIADSKSDTFFIICYEDKQNNSIKPVCSGFHFDVSEVVLVSEFISLYHFGYQMLTETKCY